MIDFILRFDDPSATSDHSLEERIFAVLEEVGIPATVAVVPFRPDGENLIAASPTNALHLIDAHRAGIIEIAQHGYAHKYMGVTDADDPSEFYNTSKESQAQRIIAGRNVLEAMFSTSIKGFVPPWNTYDGNTADILSELGYTYLSGNYVTPLTSKPEIRLIPRTSHISRIRQAYAETKRRSWLDTCIVAIMHHYDFHESHHEPGPMTLTGFKKDLEWLKNQPGVRFSTLGAMADRLSVSRCWSIHKRRRIGNGLNWRIKKHLPNELLLINPLWLYLIT